MDARLALLTLGTAATLLGSSLTAQPLTVTGQRMVRATVSVALVIPPILQLRTDGTPTFVSQRGDTTWNMRLEVTEESPADWRPKAIQIQVIGAAGRRAPDRIACYLAPKRDQPSKSALCHDSCARTSKRARNSSTVVTVRSNTEVSPFTSRIFDISSNCERVVQTTIPFGSRK